MKENKEMAKEMKEPVDYEGPEPKHNPTRTAFKKTAIIAISLLSLWCVFIIKPCTHMPHVYGQMDSGYEIQIEESYSSGIQIEESYSSGIQIEESYSPGQILPSLVDITTTEQPSRTRRDDSESSSSSDAKKNKTAVQKVFDNPAVRILVIIFGFFFVNCFIIAIHHVYMKITNTDKLYRDLEQHVSPF